MLKKFLLSLVMLVLVTGSIANIKQDQLRLALIKHKSAIEFDPGPGADGGFFQAMVDGKRLDPYSRPGRVR